MKKLLIILFIGILVTGCSKESNEKKISETTSDAQKTDFKISLDENMVKLITRVNEYAFVSNDIKSGVKFDSNYWSSIGDDGKEREKEFREDNLKIIKRINSIISYAQEKKLKIDGKSMTEITNQVNKILSGKNNFLDYCSMYKYVPTKEDLEKLYSCYVMENIVKDDLTKKFVNKETVKNAASIYEIKVPIKLTGKDDYDKQLKIARKIADDILSELNNGNPMIQVASKYGVLSYPMDYNDITNKEQNMKEYLEMIYAGKNDQIVGPFEYIDNSEVKYILIGKISEENSQKTVQKMQDIIDEREKDKLIDEKISEIKSEKDLDVEFINKLELKTP